MEKQKRVFWCVLRLKKFWNSIFFVFLKNNKEKLTLNQQNQCHLC